MPCNIKIIKDSGEYIETDSNNVNKYFNGLKIISNARGMNTVIVHEGTQFYSCYFNINNGSHVEINKSKYGITRLEIHSNNGSVKIGTDFSCWGVDLRVQEAGSKITIGNDCMFSEDILIYATDIHAIIDLDSKEIINRAKPIVISDHVWVGRRVDILKGVYLPENTIVGMGSVVTKSFMHGNISIAGNPASIIKNNVNWTRKHIDNFFRITVIM